MITELPIFKCEKCHYTSHYKGNLKRHIFNKHSEKQPDYVCPVCDRAFFSNGNLTRHLLRNCKALSSCKNVEITNHEINELTQKVKNVSLSLQTDTENVAQTEGFKCPDCYKVFSRKNNLKRHSQNCKKISHPFECPKCKKIFRSRFSKSKHIKNCNPPVVKEIMTYDRKSLPFDTSHISDDDIMDLIQNELHHDSLFMNKNIFMEFYNLVLSEPTNRCIKRTNTRAVTSKVHIGNNEWVDRHNSEIYDLFVMELSERFLERLLKIEPKCFHIKKLDTFLTYMADHGYCNSDKKTNIEIKKAFKELVQRIKSTV